MLSYMKGDPEFNNLIHNLKIRILRYMQDYLHSMRLQRRLYGIYTVCNKSLQL